MNLTEITAVFPPIIDNTILKDFRACPQRFFQRRLRGLRPMVGDVGVDAVFGGCLAAGVEAARRAYYVQGLSGADAVGEAIVTAQEAWHKEAPVVPVRSRKTLANLTNAILAYFAKWPLPPEPTALCLTPIEDGIENCYTKDLGLVHPVTGKPLMYAAKMDMVARDQYGNYVAVDEKTTGNFSDSWYAQWDIDPQMTGYIWMLQDFQLTNMPHAVIRGIEIGSAISCISVPVFRTEHQVKVWLHQTRMDVVRMLELWWDSGAGELVDEWPRTLGANCVQYGRPCEFMKLCNSPDAGRIAASEYRVERWSPLNKSGD